LKENGGRALDFSKSPERMKDVEKLDIPFYDPQMLYDSRDAVVGGKYTNKYSVSKKLVGKLGDDNPGPGQYELPVTFADVPRYSMPGNKK
jgi:hypothetical protein